MHFKLFGSLMTFTPEYRTVTDPAEITNLARLTTSDLARTYFNEPRQKTAYKWLHYLDLYDRYLASRRGTSLRFLEIGIMEGGSLELWRSYLGPAAHLWAIDIAPKSIKAAETLDVGANARLGSQADAKFLRKTVEEMGGLDVVIDDGSHIAAHQLASFKTLFPLLSPGGIYICEDLHTSYWGGEWEGGFKRAGTFIETIKEMVDSIHGWYAPISNSLDQMNLQRNLTGTHIHDSMVVLEKHENRPPTMVIK